MEDFYKQISREVTIALIAIFIIALIHQFDPKVGWTIGGLIIIVGLANIYKSGAIKPARG